MATIGVVLRPDTPDAVALGRRLLSWINASGHTGLVEDASAAALDCPECASSPQRLASAADPVVTLGGDGTLIGIARHVTAPSPTLLGVNFGQLGFLTEISPQELFDVLPAVLEGRAPLGLRNMLYATVVRGGQTIFSSQAVNEAVVMKGAREKLLTLDLAVNGEDVVRLRADGLIMATPTGSTAYSLSAGGSIVEPWLSVVTITPVCPHSLTSRPLILELDSQLAVSVPPYDGEVFLNIDGQVSCPLRTGDVVHVTRSKHSVTFVRSSSKSYFDILRTKLNWGVGTSVHED